MRYIKGIQDILSKTDYDFGRSDISLSNFHPQLYVTLAAQGIFFGKRDSYLRFLIPLSNIVVSFICLTFECLNIYRGLTAADLSLACESFCYCVVICSMIAVYTGVLFNRDKILNLIEEMENDFEQICGLGPRYREPFMAGQLLIWKLFVGWTSFTILCGSSFFLCPFVLLLYQTLVATIDEHTKRPLVFPIWFPHDDPYRTPNYEMLLVLESWYVLAYCLCYGGYVYTLFHFLIHYCIKLDMAILDFQVIFDGLDESVAILHKNDPRRIAVQLELNRRVGRIVTWHYSVYRAVKIISSIFRPSLIYQLMLSSIAICLMAYQIANKLDEGKLDVLFTLLGVATVSQLWIPCYLGTILKYKGFAVGDSCWGSGWQKTPLGTMVRSDLVMVLMRAQMPIIIKFAGQPAIQLETFSAIMSTSYSYFNMLRQTAK